MKSIWKSYIKIKKALALDSFTLKYFIFNIVNT